MGKNPLVLGERKELRNFFFSIFIERGGQPMCCGNTLSVLYVARYSTYLEVY